MQLFTQRKRVSRSRAYREVGFRRQILRGIVRLTVLVLCVGAIYYVTRLDYFSLKHINVVGGETISHDDVRRKIEDELIGSYVLLIPKRFAYTYPHNRIVDVVTKTSRIHDVTLTRSSRDTLTLSFEEYIPHALVCVSSIDTGSCFFVTKEGYVFDEAPRLEGGAFARHVLETDDEVGKGYMLSADLLARIDAFRARLNDELSLRVTMIEHKRSGDLEFVINGGGRILIAKDNDFNHTFENLTAVLASEEFAHLEPGNFNYIDVRFDNKIFVNEVTEPEMTVATTSSSTEELSE